MKPDWFLAVVRVAGASFAGAASLVQLQAEIDRAEFIRRLRALEDPISDLHEDIRPLSERLYEELTNSDSPKVELGEEEIDRFSRVLGVLEAQGLIKGTHTLSGRRFVGGVWLSDPVYLLYLYRLFGREGPMEQVQGRVEALEKGRRLDGKELRAEVGVPLPFIDALFKVYEAQGYGLRSRILGESTYIGKS